MGSAIVSTDLHLAGAEDLSFIPLAVAAVAWVGLGAVVTARFLVQRDRFDQEARSPAAFTGPAGTSVLGARLAILGWWWAGLVLLLIAAVLWVRLLRPVLRSWANPAMGTGFLLAISTASLAVLAATLAVVGGTAWPALLSLIPLTLALGFYLFVVRSFDLDQLRRGRGDQWAAGGAIAISTLACARASQAALALHLLGPGAAVLRWATLGLWIAAACWLPLLALTELARPRLGYDPRRWATVFPVGMYAASSFVAGTVAGTAAIADFARAWTWVASGVWVAVLAATLWQPVDLLRRSVIPQGAGASRQASAHL